MGFCKLILSAFIWIFVDAYFIANFNPSFPDWVVPISLAVMLSGWISYRFHTVVIDDGRIYDRLD